MTETDGSLAHRPPDLHENLLVQTYAHLLIYRLSKATPSPGDPFAAADVEPFRLLGRFISSLATFLRPTVPSYQCYCHPGPVLGSERLTPLLHRVLISCALRYRRLKTIGLDIEDDPLLRVSVAATTYHLRQAFPDVYEPWAESLSASTYLTVGTLCER